MILTDLDTAIFMVLGTTIFNSVCTYFYEVDIHCSPSHEIFQMKVGYRVFLKTYNFFMCSLLALVGDHVRFGDCSLDTDC